MLKLAPASSRGCAEKDNCSACEEGPFRAPCNCSSICSFDMAVESWSWTLEVKSHETMMLSKGLRETGQRTSRTGNCLPRRNVFRRRLTSIPITTLKPGSLKHKPDPVFYIPVHFALIERYLAIMTGEGLAILRNEASQLLPPHFFSRGLDAVEFDAEEFRRAGPELSSRQYLRMEIGGWGGGRFWIFEPSGSPAYPTCTYPTMAALAQVAVTTPTSFPAHVAGHGVCIDFYGTLLLN